MTRYQPLFLWNYNLYEAPPYPRIDRKDLVRFVHQVKKKFPNITMFYLEWDDERPDEVPLVRRFSNKELLGGEE